MAPKFISLAEVLEIHQEQLVRYGGASGIRDIELLKSALGMPATTYESGTPLRSSVSQVK